MEPLNPITPPNPNRRTLIIAAIVISVVILFVVSLFAAKQNGLILSGPKLSLSQPFAANLSFAKQIDNHTTYYYSGSAFVSYDLTTHKTKPLTPQYAMPTQIDDIVWSKTAALINATGYSQADQLYPTLPNQSLDPNQNYWWLVNFQTGTINLIGDPANSADVRGATWVGDGSFIYGEKVTDKSTINIIKRDPAGNQTKIGSLPDGAVIISASTKAVTYTQRNTANDQNALMVLDIASKKTTTAIKNIASILATSSNNNVLAIAQTGKAGTNDTTQGPLQLYDYASGKVKTLTNNFNGTATWLPDSSDWIAAGYQKLTSPAGFTSKNGKISQFTLPAPTGQDAPPQYRVVGRSSSDDVLLLNGSMQLLIAAAKTPTQLPALPDTNKLKDDLTDPAYFVSYDADKKQYSAYILEDPYQANINLVLSRIQALGLDPYQLNLKWYADESVNTGYRLAPADDSGPESDPIEDPIPIEPLGPDEGD